MTCFLHFFLTIPGILKKKLMWQSENHFYLWIYLIVICYVLGPHASSANNTYQVGSCLWPKSQTYSISFVMQISYIGAHQLLRISKTHQKHSLSDNSVFNNYARCHVFITLQIHTLRSFPRSFPWAACIHIYTFRATFSFYPDPIIVYPCH